MGQGFKNICRLIDCAKEDVAPEQSFLGDLKRSIEMTEDKAAREPSKTYKPSSMNCIRNMYYQVVGQQRDPQMSSYSLVGICNSGSDTHERIQRYVADMKNNDIDCEYVNVADFVKAQNLDYLEVVSQQGMETKLYNKTLNMSFLCDGIIKYKGKYYILELKTESAYKWQARKGVDPKHYAQGTAYSLVFHIDEVIFVYINRDILEMKAFMFKPTDEQRSELVNKILECDNYVNQGKVPPKPTQVPRSSCEYCAYKNSCRAEVDTE
jgi:CRISPR/Cas system-associated exonuclease Cas4 (RecB family)